MRKIMIATVALAAFAAAFAFCDAKADLAEGIRYHNLAQKEPARPPSVRSGTPQSRQRWLIRSRSPSDGRSRLHFPDFLRRIRPSWIR